MASPPEAAPANGKSSSSNSTTPSPPPPSTPTPPAKGEQASPSPPPPSKDEPSPSPPPPKDEPSPSPPPPSKDKPTPSPPASTPPPPSESTPSPPPRSESSPSPPPTSLSGSSPSPPPSKDDKGSPPPEDHGKNHDKEKKDKDKNSPGSNLTPTPNNPSFSSPPLPGGLPAGDGSHQSPAKDHKSDGSSALVIGVATGLTLLFLVIVSSALFCYCKKKKKHERRPSYYDDGGGRDYYNNGAKWQQGGEHNIRIPPAPGMGGGGWQQHGPPAPLSNESSGPYSGPHRPALPPPSPNLALGFNKSTFTYEELAAATGRFSPSNMLGQGGFGYVYKGVLPNGKDVAVKQLKSGSGQGEREFQAEVEIISRVHHRHLVSLVGYCITGAQRLLVYEFVPNKTLEYHLHGSTVMDWPTRLKIAIGAAKGLAYLHEDCHPRIIHRDIKTANILLDYKFEAMVADFGLAKLSSDTNTHISTRVMGTFGYLAPEYASTGKLTDKSDVFSYGVMLLELISGRRPVDHTNHMEESLVDWARPIMGQVLAEENYGAIVDPRLEGQYNPAEMARMIACGAACVRHSARRRPRVSQVVRALEGDMISFDDLNEGVKPGQSLHFGSASDESGTYSAKMREFQKMALASGEYTGEYGQYSGTTGDYRLNQSSESASSSSGETNSAAGRKPHQ